ncbi:MAG TPA: ATP-binding protein [Fluviicoccus sp.]|nr:ATP-binding protein [Fluviicoccus sp.]
MIRYRQYLLVLPVLAATVGLSLLLQAFLDDISAVMVYMLAVVLSSFFLGLGPSVLTCMFSVVLFDIFNLQPFLAFSRSPMEYLLTLGVMLVTAVTISLLADRLRRQVREAEERESRAAALYALSADMASASGESHMIEQTVRHVEQAFGGRVMIVAPEAVIPCGAAEAERLTGCLRTGDEGTLQLEVRLPAGITVGLPGSRHLQAMLEQASLAMERNALRRRVMASELKYQEQSLRSNILNALSHDMRTPLASIIGAATSLLEQGDAFTPENRRALRQIIVEEARHMQGMVDNLLDMARLQSGKVKPGQEWQAIEEIVAGAVALVRRRFGGREFLVGVPDDLPLVRCDPFLMERVLVNLLENAAKYSPEGTEIRIGAGRDGRWLIITVSDQGQGIPEAGLARVFEPFYRAESDSQPGMGLGLTLCQLIVCAHDGEIGLESVPGRGTSVRVRLPLPEEGDDPGSLHEEKA